METYLQQTINLLSRLIKTASISGEEDCTAQILSAHLEQYGIMVNRKHNNIWAVSESFDKKKPTILLNSHHDTVQPHSGYTIDPFEPLLKDGKLYGLGSNDAGGSLCCLLSAFLHFEHLSGSYNLVFAATAEEEISGEKGIASILNDLPDIDFAIVGEPTGMDMAIAEKGLLVIDGVAKGTPGHAAHVGSEHAIAVAAKDIDRIHKYSFNKASKLLGKTKAAVTQINAGTQHNVVPPECHFVIDVRVNEMYSLQDVMDELDRITVSELQPRSMRLSPSSVDVDSPVVKAGRRQGRKLLGSSTLSDQALMPFPSLKMGPGDTQRSHTADEFILIEELKEGIEGYVQLINELL